MKSWWIACLVIFFNPFLLSGKDRTNIPPARIFYTSFIENKGQWDPAIRYRAYLPDGALFLEDNCLTFTFLDGKAIKNILKYKYQSESVKENTPLPDPWVRGHAYKVRFSGSLPNPRFHTAYPQGDYKNYFLGNDPSRWASRVRQYQEITYQNLYPGTDLKVTEKEGSIKYTFYLDAGADPNQIQLSFEGIQSAKIRHGKLIITTSVNRVEELAPVTWQTTADGHRKNIACRFSLKGANMSFIFPDGYDATLPIVIDPILVFSSYSGSPVDNWGYTATYDQEGFLYAGGNIREPGYPVTVGAYQVNYGGGNSDMVISKYDSTGSFMVYSTHLGGTGTEIPASLIVNNNKELLILGCTGSADFPITPNAYDATFNGGSPYTQTWMLNYPQGSDIVVSRLSADGASLLSSTYFGGSGNDGLNTIAPLLHNYADDARGEIKLDPDQNVYICSSTQSPNLPVTPNAYQSVFGGAQDACIVKFDPTLTYVNWATYLGGSGADAGYALVIGEHQTVYVAGGTASTNFPVTPLAFQQVFNGGSCDGYVSCLSDNGSSLQFSTYYGSPAYDQVYFVDKDKNGSIYVTGQTAATGNTYIFNASWATPGGGQFITKFIPSLATIIYSTAYGTGNGGPDISPTAFLVDYCNYVYISGWGSPSLNGFGGTAGLPVTANAFQTTTDNGDYYFMVMKGDASGLIYATFFGGTGAEHVDGGTSRFDKKGRIYQSVCAGCGGFDNFPTTPGAWSNTNGSTNCNNAVIKYDFKIPLAIADFIHPPSGCAPYTVQFQNTSAVVNLTSVQYQWLFGDGFSSTLRNPAHTYLLPGTYPVTLIISDTASCNLADTLTQNIIVLGNATTNLPYQHICLGSSTQLGIPFIPDPSITYSWFPNTFLNNSSIPNPIASPLQSTLYSLLISNGSCADTLRQWVNVYDLEVDAGPDTSLCVNNYTLTAHANASSLYFYWSTSILFTDTLNPIHTDSSAFVTIGSQATWFYVKISNGYCEAIDSVLVSFSILVSPGGGQHPLCPDSCNGIAMVTVNGGNPPYQFIWSTGSVTQSISGLCQGTYSVTITDSLGCISITPVILNDPPVIVIQPLASAIPCTEVCNGSIQTTVLGGTPPYQYLWNNGHITTGISQLCEGNYRLTVHDAHGCPATTQATVNVSSIFIDVSVISDKDTIYQGQSVQIQATPFQGCTYAWSPFAGLSDPGIPNPVASPQATTVYYLTITDPFGCVFIDSVAVFIKDVMCREPYIYIPNAFTPNGDQKNDVLQVRSAVMEDIYLAIYDRWGNRVFETRTMSDFWDGTWREGTCQAGVYVYYLEVTCFNKEVFKKKGNITLIR